MNLCIIEQTFMKQTLTIVLLISSFMIFTSSVINTKADLKKHQKIGNRTAFNCVAQIHFNNKFKSSCVLINKKYALTAAHILFERQFKQDTIYENGKMAIYNTPISEKLINPKDLRILVNNEIVLVNKIIIHPNFLESKNKYSYDIAILELSTNNINVIFPTINSNTNELNYEIIGIGYGPVFEANGTSISNSNIKIGGKNTIDSLAGDKINGLNTLIICDFDSPRKDNNICGKSTPLKYEYLCTGGNSGGGMFYHNKDTKKLELIGICNSFSLDPITFSKSQYYGQTMKWCRVSAFSNWINENTLIKD